MPPPGCLCGFTELADETLTDHLEYAFIPAGSRGRDGQVHEEMARLSCSCGFTARAPFALDAHFLLVFTPANAIGRDGQPHGMLAGAR